jgi:hypothetical protein
MALTTPVLASQTLTVPTAYKTTVAYRGGRQLMADGTLVTDLVNANAKRTFTLTWAALTDAQRSTLETAHAAVKDASGSYTDISGTDYTVTLDEGSGEREFEAHHAGTGAAVRWSTTIVLREV